MIVTGQVAGLALAYGLHLFHGTRNHVGYACDRSHRVYNANYGHECKVDLRTILKTIFGDNFEYNCKNFFLFLKISLKTTLRRMMMVVQVHSRNRAGQ